MASTLESNTGAPDTSKPPAPKNLTISPITSSPQPNPFHLHLLQSQLSLAHLLLHGSTKLLEAEKLKSAAQRLVADAEREMRIGVQKNREALINTLFETGAEPLARGFITLEEPDKGVFGLGEGWRAAASLVDVGTDSAEGCGVGAAEEQEVDLISVLEDPETPPSESSPNRSPQAGKEDLDTADSSLHEDIDVRDLAGVLVAADWSSPPPSPKRASKNTSFNSSFYTNVPTGPRYNSTSSYKTPRAPRNEAPYLFFTHGIRFTPNSADPGLNSLSATSSSSSLTEIQAKHSWNRTAKIPPNPYFRTALLSNLAPHTTQSTLLHLAGPAAISAVIVTLRGRGFLPAEGATRPSLPDNGNVAMVVFETGAAASEFVRRVNSGELEVDRDGAVEGRGGNVRGRIVLTATYPGLFEEKRAVEERVAQGRCERWWRQDGGGGAGPGVKMENLDEIRLDEGGEESQSGAGFKSGLKAGRVGERGNGSKERVESGVEGGKDTGKVSWADEVIESLAGGGEVC